MKNLSNLKLQEHNGFIVARGDLLPSGIKGECLMHLMPEINENELVYAGHPYGHSGFALGLSGLHYKKKITLFFAGKKVAPYIQKQTDSLNNVTSIFLDDLEHQSDLVDIAKEYAKKNSAFYMPIGFDIPSFRNILITTAQELPIMPKEVWVPSGSGTTSRCLAEAWPSAKLYEVNLGMMPDTELGAQNVFKVPELPSHIAEIPPPYPSAKYYDAKVWRFVHKNAKKGSLIWNIA